MTKPEGLNWYNQSLAGFLVSAGFNSTVAQRILRHSNAHTTQQYYLHTVPSELVQAQNTVMRNECAEVDSLSGFGWKYGCGFSGMA